MDKIVFNIKRFDGGKSWYQEYEIPYEEGKTILWGLISIKENQDASLNFTSACRSEICGSCAVQVNGSAVLACSTSIDQMISSYNTTTLTIEPLRNFAVVRDLVVDWEPKFERMRKIKPWLIADESAYTPQGYCQSADQREIIANATDCILCGACASECEALTINAETFLEPFMFSKAYRYAADSRDAQPAEHWLPALTNGIWNCVACMQCIAKCPKGVLPAEHIQRLREISIRNGQTDNKGARHALAFYKDTERLGRLNEFTLPIQTEGLFANVRRIPFALRIFRKGKLKPLPLQRPLTKIGDIKKIYSKFRKEERI